MRYVYLEKSNLGKFISILQKSYKVVGPAKKENQFVFAEIENADALSLIYIPTILPPKKYFLPQKERLGSFKIGETSLQDTTVEIEPLVIFGAHTCDIDGMECLDVVFRDNPVDPYYKEREKSIVVIGYECMFPCDEYATCITMDTHIPKAGYDIMMTDAGKYFILHVNSDIGNDLTSTSSIFKKADTDKAKAELKNLREEKLKKFKVNLKCTFRELEGIFAGAYDSLVWDDVARRCVSCGNCTMVCPTCYCFDVYDDTRLDMEGGDRKRIWDSCQLDEFSQVAGGEIFRKKRSSRQKHRYYRKFDYPVRKYNKFFCTGCGRCTRTCMADISLIETVNALTEERSKG